MPHTTPEAKQRASQVDELFNKIAFIADLKKDNTVERDKTIKPFVDELWAITQIQEKYHELDYKRVGVKQYPRGDAWEEPESGESEDRQPNV